MTQRTLAKRFPSGGATPLVVAAPPVMVRLVGIMLALAVAAVHVADQGGVTRLTDPDWLGWAYRLIEVGGVLVAVLLMMPPPSLGRLGWAACALLGLGPFTGYIVSRTIGLPGDHMDVGNWGYWEGTVSLAVEGALVMLSLSMLLAHRQSSRAAHLDDHVPI
jgi:hypothetical protein